ncbi:lung seven transmembrane receptor family protein [Striga asiatica]|uniref:Lung seven transmembrane receptor family protein n=1 Tax=Striga asiatica TaxID=4170 RepID=A0A5A7R0K8_STRAF|nr:lung seven transmembrane receptor family protein [Striga asiatica]
MVFRRGAQCDLLLMGRDKIPVVFGVLLLLFSVGENNRVSASIHEYKNEAFTRRFNSYFFHGGSEGLYASNIIDPPKTPANDDSNKPLNGKSFIRVLFVGLLGDYLGVQCAWVFGLVFSMNVSYTDSNFLLLLKNVHFFWLFRVVALFESITFRRPKEVASKQNAMQQSTGVVEAIIVEIKDSDKIGKAFQNSNAICCDPSLAKDGFCKVGEVIIHQDPENPEWPKRLQTSFEGNNEEASMVLQTVEINKTGMYYLYFMVCDPELKGTLISGRTVWRNPAGYLPGKMAPLMTFYGFMSLAYLVLGLLWFVRFVQHWKDIIYLHYQITAVIGLGMCEMAFWYYEYANFNATGSRPIGITLWAVTFTAIKKTVSRLLLLVVSMGYGVMRPTLGGITSKVILLGVVYFWASEALELVEHLGNINDFSGKARLFLVLPVALLDACFIMWIFSSLSKTLEKLQAIVIDKKMHLVKLGKLLKNESMFKCRYAYETGDDDEEGLSLTGASIIVAGDLKERKVSIASDHVFGLVEDLEEDKRE